jgi:hypothetical protein
MVLLISFPVYVVQDSLVVHVTGISSKSVFGAEVDSIKAVINAKRKVLKIAGVDTIGMNDSTILEMSEEVLFPNYTVMSEGYSSDNLYHVILEGYVKTEYKKGKPKPILVFLGVVAVAGVIYYMYKGSRFNVL